MFNYLLRASSWNLLIYVHIEDLEIKSLTVTCVLMYNLGDSFCLDIAEKPNSFSFFFGKKSRNAELSENSTKYLHQLLLLFIGPRKKTSASAGTFEKYCSSYPWIELRLKLHSYELWPSRLQAFDFSANAVTLLKERARESSVSVDCAQFDLTASYMEKPLFDEQVILHCIHT